ncbi:MAG: tRNA-dihydrouridine synthase family protein [Candidatus Magasanikbacteria bacterium]|nr:tRNA-dihydrouridine synthase family protein [Candidatus Magasanikbacteria bacterium]
MFNWQTRKFPLIALSPMADFTDQPFSLICKKFGAQLIFREMVSADAVARRNPKTLERLSLREEERPLIQQLFGRNPKIMAEAAKIIFELMHPDGLDINMGCPARKIIKNFHGAALMKEPALAAEIVSAVAGASPLPVSVKTRLGWSNKEEILDFAPLLEKAGAAAIGVHGRTKEQGLTGPADWEMINKTKKRVKIPVLANGGIFSPSDIEECLRVTKADGVLLARGALGNPWIFAGIDKTSVPAEEIKNIILEHSALQVARYGERGLITFRKHLAFYFKGLPFAKNLKQNLARIKTLGELKEFLATAH